MTLMNGAPAQRSSGRGRPGWGEVCVWLREAGDRHRSALHSILPPAPTTGGCSALWDSSGLAVTVGIQVWESSPSAEHVVPKTKVATSQSTSFHSCLEKFWSSWKPPGEILLCHSLELGCLPDSPCRGHHPRLYWRTCPRSPFWGQ